MPIALIMPTVWPCRLKTGAPDAPWEADMRVRGFRNYLKI